MLWFQLQPTSPLMRSRQCLRTSQRASGSSSLSIQSAAALKSAMATSLVGIASRYLDSNPARAISTSPPGWSVIAATISLKDVHLRIAIDVFSFSAPLCGANLLTVVVLFYGPHDRVAAPDEVIGVLTATDLVKVLYAESVFLKAACGRIREL